MQKREIIRCRKTIKLFPTLINGNDVYVVYLKQKGFVVLEYCNGNFFESNELFDDSERLFHHLLERWDFEWFTEKMRELQLDEMDEVELNVSTEQKEEREKTIQSLKEKFRQIELE